ncbi:NDR1/HIN1-like protein 3 [Lycium ferocissimum]|uniref:NDR1/HIN1-like protein 3 n=1 Tax=Lycium ferocissimum TaxID=112874 RepID=UPI0028157FBC|nr:NDR1/HIN1-like protein 3 [Lycium ferocissimum]
MGKFCCCNCIFSCVCACIFQILCAIIVIFGIIVLAIWLIWRPNKIYFHVADASLAKFDFSPSTNTLDYDLNLSFDIRNSNEKLGVHFDFIEAKTTFHHRRFATTNLESFYQEPRNTTTLHPVIKGQSAVEWGSSEKSDYEDEKKNGAFDIYTVFSMRIRLKSGWITTGELKFLVGCSLKVPLKSDKISSSTFERTTCIPLPNWTKS